MQFVKGGPDVPEQLLRAHEDGQVVFFCGAGISCSAGLPTFSDLVLQLYDAMDTEPGPVEAVAIKANQYDTAIGLLEERVKRKTVREALTKILTPDIDDPKVTATHEALLTLGKNREERTRLITTNFDRLFEEVIVKTTRQVDHFRAPLLPIPKKRWDGLVYLHGLLTENPSESDLERLVVSSGDFGLAYLVERWAARFVSELLRNFTVCFVGYSIDDPMLRYMMDALAADGVLGESSLEMFAFGSFPNGKEKDVEREWRAKNVTPILYRKHRRHAYLHRTLSVWSKIYRDGAQGKERIVVESAMTLPIESTEQDDFVGRMIWALSDPSGLPARRFAEFDPVPPIDWLEPLSEERFGHADLAHFGVSPNRAVDKDLAFSLTCRPSPYALAPWMALVHSGAESESWDEVMEQIARWLIRHLDDPTVLLWFVKRGSVLHEKMAQSIEYRLEKLNSPEQNNHQAELERIRTNAPKAIPCPSIRTFWQLLLKGHMRARVDHIGFYGWYEKFKRDGLTIILRFDLREKLAPRVVLKESFSKLRAEVVLSSRDVRSKLRELDEDARWAEVLPELLNEFTGLLRDALDLMRELGQANARSDRSCLDQPSISKHPQNRDSQDWTPLIELVRDAWLATCDQSPQKARAAAEDWWQVPYPVFRRLALFAAAQDDIIPRHQALDWLLSDECWWLCTTETLREAMRLLVALAPRLQEAELDRVEKAILVGPPRAMSRDDMEAEDWARIQDRYIWLRLAKLAESGAKLSAVGSERMDEISARYPDWQLAENESDEFLFWIGESSEGLECVATPREPKQLIEWLKANADNDSWQDDDWSKRCREDFDATSCALSELAKQKIWPRRGWRKALQAWTEKDLLDRSWDKMALIVHQSPDEVLHALWDDVGRWLRTLAKDFKGQEERFLKLCDRLLGLECEEEEESDDPVQCALNHPVGHATDALIRWWFRRPLKDDQRLYEPLIPRFSSICDLSIEKFRHGRVLLAAHAVALFRVDRDWATQHVLPLFEWERSEVEAKAAWSGFLWSPRLYPPLMEAFKPAFLDTANHYENLGQYGVQYASLLTFAAMDLSDVFTRRELARATAALSREGLNNVAATLVRALEGAGGQRAEYCRNRVKPYLMNIWPKTQAVASASIAESFAHVCVEMEDAFPEVLKKVYPWLQGVDRPDQVVRQLHKVKLDERFPEATLKLLDVIITEKGYWLPTALEECLRAIRAEMSGVETDRRFQRLAEYLRARGGRID